RGEWELSGREDGLGGGLRDLPRVLRAGWLRPRPPRQPGPPAARRTHDPARERPQPDARGRQGLERPPAERLARLRQTFLRGNRWRLTSPPRRTPPQRSSLAAASPAG